MFQEFNQMTPQIRDLCEMLTVAFIGLCMTRKNYSEVAHPFSITKRYFFADQMGKSGFLRLAATFERVVSPDAAPIRAPDTAPVKAPVTARLKNPPVRLRLAASTVLLCALSRS
jgi:hypothetical protein